MLKLFATIGLCACLVAGAPSPIDIDDEFDELEDVCLTSVHSKDPEKECIFPFNHDNLTYYGCPIDPEDKTKRWCSTKTDENGVHISGDGAWGYCTPGCKAHISPEELLIGTDAKNDTQTTTCDYTACNGFTLKVDVFDKVVTHGQCQYPAGKNGSKDDFFCFVNADSACDDKVLDGNENEGVFISTLACKDSNAPLPRATCSCNAYYGYYGRGYGYGNGYGYGRYYGYGGYSRYGGYGGYGGYGRYYGR